jgi:hypothetical protein
VIVAVVLGTRHAAKRVGSGAGWSGRGSRGSTRLRRMVVPEVLITWRAPELVRTRRHRHRRRERPETGGLGILRDLRAIGSRRRAGARLIAECRRFRPSRGSTRRGSCQRPPAVVVLLARTRRLCSRVARLILFVFFQLEASRSYCRMRAGATARVMGRRCNSVRPRRSWRAAVEHDQVRSPNQRVLLRTRWRRSFEGQSPVRESRKLGFAA